MHAHSGKTLEGNLPNKGMSSKMNTESLLQGLYLK